MTIFVDTLYDIEELWAPSAWEECSELVLILNNFLAIYSARVSCWTTGLHECFFVPECSPEKKREKKKRNTTSTVISCKADREKDDNYIMLPAASLVFSFSIESDDKTIFTKNQHCRASSKTIHPN